MQEEILHQGDFVQGKDNPGVLLGKFCDAIYGDDKAIAYVEEIGEISQCYRDDRNIRIVVTEAREGKPNIFKVPLNLIERWDSREMEKVNL